jgi:hypothetical protein
MPTATLDRFMVLSDGSGGSPFDGDRGTAFGDEFRGGRADPGSVAGYPKGAF